MYNINVRYSRHVDNINVRKYISYQTTNDRRPLDLLLEFKVL